MQLCIFNMPKTTATTVSSAAGLLASQNAGNNGKIGLIVF